VVAKHAGTPLEALAEAEQAQWRIARRAEREVSKLMRSTMGMGGSERSVGAVARMDELGRRFDRAVRQARVLCGCREAAGDPHRRDCDSQYRRWIPRESP
jgi:hypothetical protein